MFIRKRNDRQITFSSNNEREIKRVEEKLKVIERPCCADIYYCGTAELFVRRALSFQLFFQVDVLRQKRAPIDESDDSCEKKLKLKYLFVQKKKSHSEEQRQQQQQQHAQYTMQQNTKYIRSVLNELDIFDC